MAKRGRPSMYTPELADEICQRLTEGQSLNEICKAENMPAESTVRAWALDDVQGFHAKYVRAREIQAHYLADEILRISNTPVLGKKVKRSEDGVEETEGDMIEHRRLQVDSRKWYLSKVLPKVYGDKLQVDANVNVGDAIAERLARAGTRKANDSR